MKSIPKCIAISGVKNSGKTTLMTNIIPILRGYGYKVATIKHDAHNFECDVKGTDTYKHMQAGALGTAIFSKEKFMVIKYEENISEEHLKHYFPEMDIIILEGFKYSSYPKIEVVRKGVSTEPIGDAKTFLAVATNCDLESTEYKTVGLEDYLEIARIIDCFIKEDGQDA